MSAICHVSDSYTSQFICGFVLIQNEMLLCDRVTICLRHRKPYEVAAIIHPIRNGDVAPEPSIG